MTSRQELVIDFHQRMLRNCAAEIERLQNENDGATTILRSILLCEKAEEHPRVWTTWIVEYLDKLETRNATDSN